MKRGNRYRSNQGKTVIKNLSRKSEGKRIER